MNNYFKIFAVAIAAIIAIFFTSCKKDNEIKHPYAIGQSHEGGIIFYIDGTWEHGLICTANDLGNGASWQLQPVFATNVKQIAVGTGQTNTNELVSILGEGVYAAKLCDDLVLNGFSDWFLPSKDELALMYSNLAGTGIGNFTAEMGIYYWSSSEIDENNVWTVSFYNFAPGPWANTKINQFPIRAVRAF
jgi:hypothetical protein